MNRKQRRAALKHSPLPSLGPLPADPIKQLLIKAAWHQQQNELGEAVRLYRRVLSLKPDHAEAHNNLGAVLLAQAKLSEASTHFARALALTPQLSDQFFPIRSTLIQVLPQIEPAMQRAFDAWPTRLPAYRLFGSAGLAAIASDALLLCILQSTSVRNVPLERLLTSLRSILLSAAVAGQTVSDAELIFCCALAKQCFINEYVFIATPAEEAQVEQLVTDLRMTLATGDKISSLWLAAIAMYRPLDQLTYANVLVDRQWPPAVNDVLTQQVREVRQEQALRDTIPRLTPIDDDVSQRVRQQYEENPYPRWVDLAGDVEPIPLNQYLRELFPTAAFTPLTTSEPDILVAGCGTGRHAIWMAQRFAQARFTAVDLSLSSLCFAKRKTPPALAERISYAQADILKLGAIGRSFDMIDASGVLHHMADPLAGWRILLTLLKPGGFMHMCLYSEFGRGDVSAARQFVAERGYTTTAADIRRCRQDLLDTPLRTVTRFNDYFNTSDCRDLLFHVQETCTTIPALKAHIAEYGLKFVGFAFNRGALQRYLALFAQNGWSMSDLDRWHELEIQQPDTFSGMYQIWLQKP